MAGRKGQKSPDDKNKKRKRDTGELDTKPKRHRKDEKSNASKPAEATEHNGQLQPAPTPVRGNGTKAISKTDIALIQQTEDSEAGWRVSKPMGGRMLDIDPILTADDQLVLRGPQTQIQF